MVDKTHEKVLEMLLASVIWVTHPNNGTGYFRGTGENGPSLPMDHPIRGHTLLRDGVRLKKLQSMVRCGFGDDDSLKDVPKSQIPTTTGMSPHALALRNQQLMMKKLKSIEACQKKLVEDMPTLIQTSVGDSLQSFAQEHGNVTSQTLAGMENRMYDRFQTMLDSSGLGTNGRSAIPDTTAPVTGTASGVGFTWANGACRFLPENFQLPKVNLKSGMEMWFSPNTSGQIMIPSLRNVGRKDFGVKTQLNRFSGDWAPLFRNIEKKLVEERSDLVDFVSWQTQPNKTATAAQIDAIWEQVKTWIPENTKKGKKRNRPSDYKISFAKKIFSKKKKKKQHHSTTTVSFNECRKK